MDYFIKVNKLPDLRMILILGDVPVSKTFDVKMFRIMGFDFPNSIVYCQTLFSAN